MNLDALDAMLPSSSLSQELKDGSVVDKEIVKSTSLLVFAIRV